MFLAAFLVQAHPTAPALHKIIPHFHLEHGVNAGEAVDYGGDKRAIAQTDDCRFAVFLMSAPPVLFTFVFFFTIGIQLSSSRASSAVRTDCVRVGCEFCPLDAPNDIGQRSIRGRSNAHLLAHVYYPAVRQIDLRPAAFHDVLAHRRPVLAAGQPVHLRQPTLVFAPIL